MPMTSQSRFGIVTSEGTVLANVDGSATGYTNTELHHVNQERAWAETL